MTTSNEQRYSLPESTLNTILQYLGTKPYNEVAQLIGAVQQQLVKIESQIEQTSVMLTPE